MKRYNMHGFAWNPAWAPEEAKLRGKLEAFNTTEDKGKGADNA